MAMNTSTTVLYPTPPPTVNTLDPHQRLRLIKSTRKLGDVLGTTPYLLDSSDRPITLLPMGTKMPIGRQRSLFSQSASSSTSSFGLDSPMFSPSSSVVSLPSSNESSEVLPVPRPGFSDTKNGRSKDAPAPLYIRLNTVPVSPSDIRFAAPLPPTPSTATPRTVTQSTFPLSPSTPTFDQSEVKRKRMAKLTRHLGETIPPHLISAEPKKSPAVGRLARMRRGLSAGGTVTESVSELGFSPHKPAVSYSPTRKPEVRQTSWVGEWNRDNMQEVQEQLRALR